MRMGVPLSLTLFVKRKMHQEDGGGDSACSRTSLRPRRRGLRLLYASGVQAGVILIYISITNDIDNGKTYIFGLVML